MDWIHQNKLKNWLIIGLLTLNVLTISIIWMQTTKTKEPQRKEQGTRPSESVTLMRKALDLTEEQTNQLIKIQTSHLEQLRKNNDRLNENKLQLAEELFKNYPDTSLANVKANEIGELQSKVEMLRFKHFHELLAICTPEQKEKLKPIVIEVIGRKPPKDEPGENKPLRDGHEEKHPGDKNLNETIENKSHILSDEKPAPPSVEEKLRKYSEQLNLSAEQVQKIRSILLNTKQKGEQLRTSIHLDPNQIVALKDRIRKEEDEGIMRILNEGQNKEFKTMISKRR
jgi:Spy/CpxP family protein refolding chaperone